MRLARPGLATGAVSILALVAAACAAPAAPSPVPSVASASQTAQATFETTPTPSPSVASPAPETPPPYALGRFPEFPTQSIPQASAAALQGVLDAAVEDGTFAGITAAVIVADQGSWAGASGSAGGVALTVDSRRPTHSSAKTIVAAEVLRLVEAGRLALDDPASDYLPPELAFFDANGATIRQVLGMRSGIPDLNEYEGFYPAEKASTVKEVFRMLPGPRASPGVELHYASTNYVLLGAIIEHVTGLPLSEALRAGVLDRPGLEGIVYTVDDALAGDGWGVETTPASWARWAYDLYGGSVISAASLHEMTTGFEGQWYGLGTMDFAGHFGAPAVGHYGESSVTTCCSVIKLAALPEEGVVISVQADTGSSISDQDYIRAVDALTKALRDAARI
jgi:CubicO group peptidase (beta-lactamase class C family)